MSLTLSEEFQVLLTEIKEVLTSPTKTGTNHRDTPKDRLQLPPVPPVPIPPLDPFSSAVGGALGLAARQAIQWARQTSEKARKRRNEQYESIIEDLERIDEKLMDSTGNCDLVWNELTEIERSRVHDTVADQLRELDAKISKFNAVSKRLSTSLHVELDDNQVYGFFPDDILQNGSGSPAIITAYDGNNPQNNLSCQKWLFYFGPLLINVENGEDLREQIEEYAADYRISEHLACIDWDMRSRDPVWYDYFYSQKLKGGGVWKTLHRYAGEFDRREDLYAEITGIRNQLQDEIDLRRRTLIGEYYYRTKEATGLSRRE